MKRGKLILSFYFLFFFFAASSSLFAGYDFDEYEEDEYERTYSHRRMECCECFVHCDCFKENIVYFDQYYPLNNSKHPLKPIDRAWHEVIRGILIAKKEGPFFNVHSFTELFNYYEYDRGRHIHSLSDYLEIIEKFKRWIHNAWLHNIASYKDRYSSPKEESKLREHLIRIDHEYQKANQILDEIPIKVIPLYQEVIRKCPHDFLFSVYNKGVLHSLECRWDDVIEDLKKFIELADKNQLKNLNSKFYQTYGESCLEVHLFHEAIDALTKAIKKDPENKQAYFYRASAYFETGNFDQAIQDYLISNKINTISISNKASKDFTNALFNSLCQGAADAMIDFVPSLCHTTYGLGKALWVTAQHPVDSTKVFAGACYEMGKCFVDYCKTVDADTIDGYVDQLKILYEHFDQLSDAEKGNLIGYTIGKYGVDIFAGGFVVGGAIKGGKLLANGALACRNLKNVNRACNLEAMAISNANKEAIIASSLKHTSERGAFFKNIKIEWDKQNKHVIGKRNYDPKKSIFEHSNPEDLLKKYSGKGKYVRGNFGEPGYQEVIDFEEFIGYNVCDQTGEKIPTTWGKIHYSKKGAHIVPTRPKQ